MEVDIDPFCLGIFWSGFGFPTVRSHLGISSMSQGPGPPLLAAARALVAAGALPSGGAAHYFHPFFKDYGCCQGLFVDIPH